MLSTYRNIELFLINCPNYLPQMLRSSSTKALHLTFCAQQMCCIHAQWYILVFDSPFQFSFLILFSIFFPKCRRFVAKGSIMFHVRRRPADSQPRRRKKKPLGVSNGSNNVSVEREGPMLVEITHSGDGGRRVKLGAEPIEVNLTLNFLLTFSSAQTTLNIHIHSYTRLEYDLLFPFVSITSHSWTFWMAIFAIFDRNSICHTSSMTVRHVCEDISVHRNSNICDKNQTFTQCHFHFPGWIGQYQSITIIRSINSTETLFDITFGRRLHCDATTRRCIDLRQWPSHSATYYFTRE